MKKTFRLNYVRSLSRRQLLGLAGGRTCPGHSLRWQPWNQVVSEKEYEEIKAKKGSRNPRQGWALAQARWDDPPHLPEFRGNLSKWQMASIFTVHNNTFALCRACHLSS